MLTRLMFGGGGGNSPSFILNAAEFYAGGASRTGYSAYFERGSLSPNIFIYKGVKYTITTFCAFSTKTHVFITPKFPLSAFAMQFNGVQYTLNKYNKNPDNSDGFDATKMTAYSAPFEFKKRGTYNIKFQL